MTEAKEILQLIQTMDAMKAVMALLALLLLVALVYLRNQAIVQRGLNERLAARERSDDEIRKLQEQAEQRAAESQARRENAQIGVLSQLAAQVETQQTIQQQQLDLLSRTVTQLETTSAALNSQIAGITERNKIQAEQTTAIKETTEAVRRIAPEVADAIRPVAQEFRGEVMRDAQAWVDGLKAEARGPLATIEGIPKRLESHEQRLEAMIDRVPAAVAAALAIDLRHISDELIRLSERIERSVFIPPREFAVAPVEGTPINERPAAGVNPAFIGNPADGD